MAVEEVRRLLQSRAGADGAVHERRLPREKKIALAAHLTQAGLGVVLSAEAGIFSRSLH